MEMLGPSTRLLDVGCGCGRVARYLLDSPIAAYAGFDRHRGMIEWAQSYISSRDERFEFRHVDVQSGYEELDRDVGMVSAVDLVFPYEDRSFTSALAASVFTHIDFSATSHYLSETARVLGRDGAILASYFPGDETGKLGGSNWNFVIREDDLREAVERAGLELLLLDPRHPGQNFLVARKPGG